MFQLANVKRVIGVKSTRMLTRSRSRSTEDESVSSSQSQSLSQTDSAPQEIYVPKKNSLNRKKTYHVAQWICLLPEDADEQFNSSFISLKDPKTACVRRYLLRKRKEEKLNDVSSKCELHEVMSVSDGPRSWFINNTVQTEGFLYMCTPIDPLFVALPYLQAAAKSGKFTTLDAILDDPVIHCSRMLEECVGSDQWEHIADTKELSNGLKVYKYSWERTHTWLKAKVEALGTSLEEEGVYVGTGSMSTSLVRSSKQGSMSRDDYLRYACGLISDYLSRDIAEQLALDYPSLLGSTLITGKHKREADSNGEINGAPPTKKGRPVMSDGEPLDDYTKLNTKTSESKQVTPLTPAQKALAKVDKTGMKSISSFFAPTSKKMSI